MAEPKKRLSRTRSNTKRALYVIADQAVSICKNCGEPVRPHTICEKCGFYKKSVINKQIPTKRIVLGSEASDKSK